MSTKSKFYSSLVVLSMLFGVIIAGCSSSSNKSGSSTTAPNATAPGTSSPAASAATKAPKVELTMFFGDSGVPHTPGVDLSNNPFINIVEDYANVDLKLDVPQSQDFKTKLDLLLASGKLPDLVHNWYPDDSIRVADEGAFIDLKKYYDNSPVIQKVITPEMMELSKSASGHYYRIPMAWKDVDQGWWLRSKTSLINKYNDGVWPTTVEGWIDLMYKIHEADPNAVVMANRVVNNTVIRYGGAVIYNMYGAEPYKYRVQDGKVISTFVTPEYREATTVMKKLYDDGILDKEFATSDTPKYVEKWYFKDVLLEWNSGDRTVHNARDEALSIESPNPEVSKAWELKFAPPLTEFKSDEKYVWPYLSYPIQAHGVYISSSSKHPDEAFKVIEGFALDEFHDAWMWGKEGETYTVKDGKRIPDLEKMRDPQHSWGKMLYIVTGNRDQELVKAQIEMSSSPEYVKELYDSAQVVADMAEKKGYALSDFFKSASDEALKKTPEMQQYISKVTVEAIMGTITMAEFDKRVQEFEGKYGFIYNEMNEFMNANKDDLRSKGVKEVDW